MAVELSEPEPNNKENQPKKRTRTGGRLGAADYNADETISLAVDTHHVGSHCDCGGRLYAYGESAVIRITGQSIAKVTQLNCEQLRCNGCGDIITARLPAEFQFDKYSASFKAVLSMQKYYLGTPFYALERLQSVLKKPLPDATQWMLCEQVADCVYPVLGVLELMLASGSLISYDDTRVRILSHLKTVLSNPDTKRRGCYTTAVLGSYQNHPISLFYSSPKHAGENMATILAKRSDQLTPIKTMSDALAANLTHQFKVIICHCLAHGLRKFREIEHVFPNECQFVLHTLRQVYAFDEDTLALSEEERLMYHQKHSLPLMDALYAWLNRQFTDKLIEPNSHMGKTINYMLKHWHALTQFMRVPGAPLDNNHVERALKLPIRSRKTAMFYKSEHGAYVAGLLMSLIQTTIDNKENPVEYLTALQENKSRVFKEPALWLPWNYKLQLVSATSNAIAA
jgi:hypothetical protein